MEKLQEYIDDLNKHSSVPLFSLVNVEMDLHPN